uniref:Dienelactone hydrolase domain-containing protein n=1 Tax=Chrysotila carterae TaxID=13221 RepID=A0A7S4B1N5_CHRCT
MAIDHRSIIMTSRGGCYYLGGRAKEMCDTLASHGFHVAMPDIFFGSSLEAHGGFGEPAAVEWLKSKSESAKLLRQSQAAVAKLKERGAQVIAGVGFCWGAYPVVKCSAAGIVSACVSFHPSLKIGNMFFGEQEADLAAAVKGPQCYLPAGNDPPMYTDGTIEKAVTDKAGQPCVVKNFPEMKHGFVLRGDVSDPAVSRDVNAAIETAVAFLKEHM